MFKQLFKQEAEKPASTTSSEEGKDVLHERIGRLVKAPRPKPQETSHGSHVTEPTVLPREKLGLGKTEEHKSPSAPSAARPNDRRRDERDQSDRAPAIANIYITNVAFQSENPYEVISINTNLVSFFLFDALYRVEELQQDAFRLYSVDYYLTQVLKSGHAIFAKNAHGLYPTWRGIREGLTAMGATEHLAIFQSFFDYLKEDEERAALIRSGSGFGKVDLGIKAMDEDLRHLEETKPLVPIASEWVRQQPAVMVLDPDTLETTVRTLAEHPILKARRG